MIEGQRSKNIWKMSMASKGYYNGCTLQRVEVNGQLLLIAWSGAGVDILSNDGTIGPHMMDEILKTAKEHGGYWLTWLEVWPENFQEESR